MFGNLGLPELVLIIALGVVLGALLTVVPYWFILKKAGFHPALSLLVIIPLGSVVMRFFLAFAEWPSLKKSSS